MSWARGWVSLLTGFVLAGCGGGGGEAPPEEAEVPLADRGTYLHITLPSIIGAHEETTLKLRVVTQAGLPDYDFEGDFRLQANAEGVEFAALEPTKEGFFEMKGMKFGETGVQFIRGSVPDDTVKALANPFVVVEDPEYRVYWGDLNGHSDLSSGSRAPGVYFWYAKSVGLLDFVALTDNDRVSDDKSMDADTFLEIQEIAAEFEAPGSFVILPAFEWSSPEYGHRLVYWNEPPSDFPSRDAGVDSPAKVMGSLSGGAVVAVAHPAGAGEGPPVDPGALAGEGLVEIYSSLGTFEREGAPRTPDRATAGAFAVDLLNRGLRAGFIASSDTRLTTPGNPRAIGHGDLSHGGGLTAVLAKELTRESILEALRERRCYATSGRRYLLEFTVDGRQMGSEIRVAPGHEARAYGSLGSTTKWVRVEIVGPDGPLASLTPEAETADVVELTATVPVGDEPTWLYLRGVDEFGGMAWSSPVYLVPE